MQLAQVVGTVVASHADEGLEGLRLVLLREIDARGNAIGSATLVAADTVGATDGDTVLVSQGAAARRTPVTRERPVDCAVIAVVESIEPHKAAG